VRWAFQTPWPLVLAHLRMIPVLTAEESLLAAARMALGSGRLKRHDAQALHRQWVRQTGRERRARRPAGSLADLAALGIVTTEDEKGGPTP
jgi:hypothetical protein